MNENRALTTRMIVPSLIGAAAALLVVICAVKTDALSLLPERPSSSVPFWNDNDGDKGIPRRRLSPWCRRRARMYDGHSSSVSMMMMMMMVGSYDRAGFGLDSGGKYGTKSLIRRKEDGIESSTINGHRALRRQPRYPPSSHNDKISPFTRKRRTRLSASLSSGYFPEPTFRTMHTGEGILSLSPSTNNDDHKQSSYDCQYAQFGPRQPFSGQIETGQPPEANAPLSPLSPPPSSGDGGTGTVLVLKRGLCSFEAKMRAAMAVGAEGVVLVNDGDEAFLAVADAVPATAGEGGGGGGGEPLPPPPREIPFVVVSSSTGAALTEGCHVSITPFTNGTSTCFGTWRDNNNNEDKEDDERGEMVLPLFPVSKQPLLPGGEITMRLTKLERHELQQQQQQSSSSSSSPIHVVVSFCNDPAINSMAVTGCMARVLAGPVRDRSVVLRGVEPCTVKTLLRDSTRNSFALALVVPHPPPPPPPPPPPAPSLNETSVQQLTEKLRSAAIQAYQQQQQQQQAASTHNPSLRSTKRIDAINDEINALPTDPDGLSFAACRLLDLPPRQAQAALECGVGERLDALEKILTRNHHRYNSDAHNDDHHDENEEEQGCNDDAGTKSSFSSRNFVSRAIQKVLPSVVRIELSNNDEKTDNQAATGFFITKNGIIVTNRHVIAPAEQNTSVQITITTQDGTSLTAEILAVSEAYDIAFLRPILLQQQEQQFPVAPMGNGDIVVHLGDWVIAIGTPAEFDNLVSLGIVSTVLRPKAKFQSSSSNTAASSTAGAASDSTSAAIATSGGGGGDGRSRTKLVLDRNPTFIGTDALFNKGISGGPLVDDTGNVVGMCTYLREDLNGLGFAVAMNRVEDAAHELLDGLNI